MTNNEDIKARLRDPAMDSHESQQYTVHTIRDDCLLDEAADRIEALERTQSVLEDGLMQQSEMIADYARQLADAVREIETQSRWKMEAQKGNAMYEHVRTLNPHQFGQLCADNIAGKGKFDELVLADMNKRKKELT